MILEEVLLISITMPLKETQDFNALTDYKQFFNQSVKNKHEAYEKLVEISRNNDNTTQNLLDYLYHQKYYWYRFIGK